MLGVVLLLVISGISLVVGGIALHKYNTLLPPAQVVITSPPPQEQEPVFDETTFALKSQTAENALLSYDLSGLANNGRFKLQLASGQGDNTVVNFPPVTAPLTEDRLVYQDSSATLQNKTFIGLRTAGATPTISCTVFGGGGTPYILSLGSGSNDNAGAFTIALPEPGMPGSSYKVQITYANPFPTGEHPHAILLTPKNSSVLDLKGLNFYALHTDDGVGSTYFNVWLYLPSPIPGSPSLRFEFYYVVL